MAQTMVIGNNYYVAFASGQGAVTSASYYTYGDDLDATLLTLFNTVNLHTLEINNIQGPGSVLPLDLLQYDRYTIHVNGGLIGVHSYFPTIQDAPNDNRIDVATGSALVQGVRVAPATAAVLTATYAGGGDTLERFLNVNTQGIPTLVDTASVLPSIVDLWHFDIDSGSVLSNPTRLAPVFWDGDDYERSRVRRGTTPWFDGTDSIEFIDGNGSDTLERTVGDWTADGFVNGQDIQVDDSELNDGPYTLTGLSALVMTVTGGSFADEGPSTGIKVTGGHFLFSDFDGLHDRLEQLDEILAGLEPSSLRILFPAGTAPLPSIAPIGDPNTGVYWPAADEVALTAGGVHVVRAHGGAAQPEQLRAADGTETNPVYSFQTDPTSGMRSPGVDQLSLVTNEIDAVEIGATQLVSSATQARARATVTTGFNIAHDTATDIDWETEVTDIGGMIDVGGANPDRFTVPAGGAGWYEIGLNVLFDEDSGTGTPNGGVNRAIAISIDGTIESGGLGQNDPHPTTNSDTIVHVTLGIELAVGQIVRGVAYQDSTGTRDVFGNMSIVKVW